MRRNKIQIISDILRICMEGACKTKIVYSANLNFRTINPYLNLLSSRGMIAEVKDQDRLCCYETTEKGKKALENLEMIQNDLIRPLSIEADS